MPVWEFIQQRPPPFRQARFAIMNFLSAPQQCNHHTPILMTVHDFEQHVGFGYISFELPPIAVSVPCPLCFVEDNNLLNRRPQTHARFE